MRFMLLVSTFLVFDTSIALGGGEVTNARDLRDQLMSGHRPAKIEAVSPERSCSATDCSVDVERLSIFRKSGVMQRTGGRRIQLKQYGPIDAAELPEIDWDPIGSFRVFRSGKQWGTCLEFGHTGIGKSGRFQRWTSVVLVPWKGPRSKPVAFRFVGYWAGCDYLVDGAKAGEISLPTIESSATDGAHLSIVWHHCSLESCVKVKDPRIVNGDPGSESGALVINGQ